MNAPAHTAIAEAVAHAFLPPSGAGTWVRCAAAPSMWQRYPEIGTDKVAADEGIAAHWVFAEMLYNRPVTAGVIAPNGVVVTDEMIDGAELYVADIDQVLAEAGLSREWLVVEQRISMPSIHPLNWGTPDTYCCAIIHNGVVYLWDYKFGHGYVEEFENWQLIDYAAGILDAAGVNGLQDQAIRVVMTVVQPRCYSVDSPVRRWSVIASELRPHFNILRNAAEKATQPNPAATPNDGCEHCSGRHACQALQREGYKAADASMRSIPVDLSPAAMGLELHYLERALKRLEARVSGLREHTLHTIVSGTPVPLFGAEQSNGRQRWNKPVAEVIALGELLGKDLKKVDVITPKQAIAKGVDEAVIMQYSEVPRGNMKLVPDNLTKIRKVFSK